MVGFEGRESICVYDKMVKGKWNLDKDVDMIWNEMANCIKRVAKDVLGES